MKLEVTSALTITEDAVIEGTEVATSIASDEDGEDMTFSIDDTTHYNIELTTGKVTLTQKGADLVNKGEDLADFNVTAQSTSGETSSNTVTVNPVNTTDVNDTPIAVDDGMITIRSKGYYQTTSGWSQPGVMIDGDYVSGGNRGITVTTLDVHNNVVSNNSFDTYDSDDSSQNLINHLASLQNSDVKIIITTNDEWISKLNSDAKYALVNIGASSNILDNVAYRSSYILVSKNTTNGWSAEKEDYAPEHSNALEYIPISTSQDIAIKIDVLANDTDEDENALSITQIQGQDVGNNQTVNVISTDGAKTVLGTAKVVDAKIVFTPDNSLKALGDGDNQNVTFAYTVSDGQASNTANVTVNVRGTNDAVVGHDDVGKLWVNDTNAETVESLKIGTFNGDSAEVSDWGTLEEGKAVFTQGDITVTTSVSTGSLTAYNTGGSVGVGIGNETRSGIQRDEILTMKIEGANVNKFSFTIDGLGAYFEEDHATNKTAIIITGYDTDGNYIDKSEGYKTTDGSSYESNYSLETNTPISSITVTSVGSRGNFVIQNVTLSSTENIQIPGHFESVTEDTPVIIDVLKNDVDIDSDPLTITKIQGKDVSNGQIVNITLSDGHNTILGTAKVVDGKIVFLADKSLQSLDAGDKQDIEFEYTVSDGATTDTATATVTVTGLDGESIHTRTLTDGVMVGVEYNTSSGLHGFTDEYGSYSFRDGDTITFNIGGVVLGSVKSDEALSNHTFLQDIANVKRTDLNDEYLENMATFLQSIDSDSGDNIVITQAIRGALSDAHIDLRTASEEDIKALVESVGATYVEEEQAMEHVQEMLEKYAGIDASAFDKHTDDSLLHATLQTVAIGVSYTTSSGEEGVTGLDGTFTYAEGDTITFIDADGKEIATINSSDIGDDNTIAYKELTAIKESETTQEVQDLETVAEVLEAEAETQEEQDLETVAEVLEAEAETQEEQDLETVAEVLEAEAETQEEQDLETVAEVLEAEATEPEVQTQETGELELLVVEDEYDIDLSIAEKEVSSPVSTQETSELAIDIEDVLNVEDENNLLENTEEISTSETTDKADEWALGEFKTDAELGMNTPEESTDIADDVDLGLEVSNTLVVDQS